MTQPLSKPDLVALQQATIRRAWLKALREQGERQCVGLARRAHLGRHPDRELWFAHHVCAMALLGEVTEGPAWFLRHPDGNYRLYVIGAKAGLSTEQVSELVARNDGGACGFTGKAYRPHTFRQMCLVVERWFA